GLLHPPKVALDLLDRRRITPVPPDDGAVRPLERHDLGLHLRAQPAQIVLERAGHDAVVELLHALLAGHEGALVLLLHPLPQLLRPRPRVLGVLEDLLEQLGELGLTGDGAGHIDLARLVLRRLLEVYAGGEAAELPDRANLDVAIRTTPPADQLGAVALVLLLAGRPGQAPDAPHRHLIQHAAQHQAKPVL